MKTAPIVLFVYARPDHARRTLESLMANRLADCSELFIYADGPKPGSPPELLSRLEETRALIRSRQWCGKVHITELEENLGVDDITTTFVGRLLRDFDRLIVLEDDIVTSPGFLSYMNDALELYKDEESVMSVNGYSFPLSKGSNDHFLIKGGTSSWGWATWRRAWVHFNPDHSDLIRQVTVRGNLKKIMNLHGAYNYFEMLNRCSSEDRPWDIRWYASVLLNNGLSVWPGDSLVQNIGHDNSGVHCVATNEYSHLSLIDSIKVDSKQLLPNAEKERKIALFFWKAKAKNFMKQIQRILKFEV